ncbi:hypothetical protein AYX14_01042 [Cryptococcus neoformans]|nr:hypothetical protein AYX15_00041 [Cryptococcus neoformans var. grubii]OWZ73502.1 hypothetical protein AYX14_01042 [Cryptococcus neoformans var. grubii]OWZ79675.1 ribonuclease P/MRP protein subunit POP5 [Cryptococcus neoformans var. grubii Bt85]OXG21178.1 ribonuclease P/MRP protein subunit POP5 [Cryptococcus neoformans var. grubii Tu401-1]OXM80722.1 ribonuclease P/MRP protein subunit POP5 [Cryptococcus neoformans var. grubii Bt63]
MVRFKNRYLLVEFLLPTSLSSTLDTHYDSMNPIIPKEQVLEDNDSEDEEDEEEFSPIPSLPFMVPTILPDSQLGEEGGQGIYKAVRSSVISVFGDEGWGRIASSFRVIYHSPLTTLTFLRIARPHYRLLWSALTFMTSLGNTSVIPRVIAISGTIKKLQNRGIAYHRAMVGALISAGVDKSKTRISLGGGAKLEKEAEREREEMERMQET